MSEHAFLAPSGASVWAPPGGCRAYPRMVEQYPEDAETEAARQGTAAHWVVSETLLGRPPAEGSLDPAGTAITEEMIDCAEDMIVDVRDTFKSNPGAELWVEEKQHMPVVDPLNSGTPDAFIVNRATKRIFGWDYKFGHGFVDARENWQMLDYLIGVLSRVAGDPVYWDGWRAVLTVAQPRNYHSLGSLREWQVSGEHLRDYYLPIFQKSAAEALKPDAPATTGPHCRYCPARHACAALSAAAYTGIDVSLQQEPLDLTGPALGLEMRLVTDAIKRLEARKTGLEAQAEARLRKGERIPHYGLEYAGGSLAWTVEPAEIYALGEMMGVDLRAPEKPLTPTQAKTKFKKSDVDGSVIDAYAKRPTGAQRLVRVDDAAARLAFEA